MTSKEDNQQNIKKLLTSFDAKQQSQEIILKEVTSAILKLEDEMLKLKIYFINNEEK